MINGLVRWLMLPEVTWQRVRQDWGESQLRMMWTDLTMVGHIRILELCNSL